VYDHNKIQFNKISLLTRPALALTTTGELYGWGSNEGFRLGLPEEVKTVQKPAPLDYFNNKDKFNLVDIAAGDDHSFVYAVETDKYNGKFDSIIQIGYNKDEADDNACIHRGISK
jgi:alpha-tubulin suppressor-like RCC1 family protein